MFILFFFSSRRRHTRWPRDWSSDVCSSDYSVFNFKEYGQVTLTGGERASTITMFQKDGYSENLQIRYGFLAGEKANYSGMAEYYRDYLSAQNHLSPLEQVEEIPFYFELVGTMLERKT